MRLAAHTAAPAFLFIVACACTDPVVVEGASCDDIHACPGELVCAGGACVEPGPPPPFACSEDADCPAGICLPEAHVCVGCARHEDCISLLCEFRTHICMGCKADWQCSSGSCDENTGLCEKSSTNPSD